MIFKQIRYYGDNFSYIIADETTREAVVVDPSFNANMLTQILKNEKLHLKYIFNTHGHPDHIATNENLKRAFNAKIVAHKKSEVNKDIGVEDGDVLKVGEVQIKIIHTPGHAPDSICLLINNEKLLTGDTLFVGECGRTDLPGGNSKELYHSLFNKLMKLDDNIEVYPGHDYGIQPYSTIGIERKTNYVLKRRTLEEFIEFMGG
jgi:glyoxylase-like metal-dependent hydrolase (beta-lactamase superfamily II)